MRIVFLTPWDLTDRDAWSGIVRPAYDALSELDDVIAVRCPAQHSLADRALARAHGQLGLGGYLPSFGVMSARRTTRNALEQMRDLRADVVLAFGASDALYATRFPAPVVQLCEATFTALVDYYPTHTGLSRLSAAQGRRIERASVALTSGFLATSRWAAQRLGEDCGVEASRVRVVPLGPGVDASAARPTPGRANGDGPRLLVVAKDWERKDGVRAVRVAEAVRAQLPGTRLTVVGRELAASEWITSVARLSRDELVQVYRDHDLLLELTRANTGGVVLADAASAALPVVANATGAVPSLVQEDRTGLLVAPDESDSQVAARIAALIRSGVLETMRRASRELYEQSFNWPTWARHTHAFLTETGRS